MIMQDDDNKKGEKGSVCHNVWRDGGGGRNIRKRRMNRYGKMISGFRGWLTEQQEERGGKERLMNVKWKRRGKNNKREAKQNVVQY